MGGARRKYKRATAARTRRERRMDKPWRFGVASRPGIFLLGDEMRILQGSCARRGVHARVEEFMHDVVELLISAEVWVQVFWESSEGDDAAGMRGGVSHRTCWAQLSSVYVSFQGGLLCLTRPGTRRSSPRCRHRESMVQMPPWRGEGELMRGLEARAWRLKGLLTCEGKRRGTSGECRDDNKY